MTSYSFLLKDDTFRYKDADIYSLQMFILKDTSTAFWYHFPQLAEDSQILHNQTDAFDLDD